MFRCSIAPTRLSIVNRSSNLRNVNQRIANRRSFATSDITAKALRYESYGTPESVLKLEQIPISNTLQPNQILVKMLAAPINPSDLNIIEGTYGTKFPLPAIGGNEGVGKVISVGSNVQSVKTGDQVVPAKSGLGTWRTHGVFQDTDVRVVPPEIPVEYAACITVNPCTAVRLLEDFVPLNAGDVIIQNGANSMVGQSIIQLAKLKKVKTINIIRERPEFAETVERLKELGGDIVVSEDYFKSPQFRRLIKDLPAPKLALNGVGGSTATEMSRIIGHGATMVTYGGMAREPVTVPTRSIIFNNIQLKGFWLTKWLEQHSEQDQQKMFQHVYNLVMKKNLQFRIETWNFDYWSQGFKKLKEQRDRKLVFTMDK